MDSAAQNADRGPAVVGPTAVSRLFEGSATIAEARDMARDFLDSVRGAGGPTLSAEAVGMVQLVVSELVTNARKHAPGPCLLDLALRDTTVQVGVWDSSSTLPLVRGRDPSRIGQHGLELVKAVCRSLYARREGTGKRVTAFIDLAEGPAVPGADPETS
ncbi:ATP-binding protein [Streptomyces sp. enrichment culture]|uniref:ATP-binding protein n=1 Tax=Streptomyces sp. enrichment culture TaxID=1795815 RepID=UPI003F551505